MKFMANAKSRNRTTQTGAGSCWQQAAAKGYPRRPPTLQVKVNHGTKHHLCQPSYNRKSTRSSSKPAIRKRKVLFSKVHCPCNLTREKNSVIGAFYLNSSEFVFHLTSKSSAISFKSTYKSFTLLTNLVFYNDQEQKNYTPRWNWYVQAPFCSDSTF